eukprot:4627428-Pyramimonas_sp.AAC.1
MSDALPSLCDLEPDVSSVPSLRVAADRDAICARRNLARQVTTRGAWCDEVLLPLTRRALSVGARASCTDAVSAHQWVDYALAQ